MGGGGPQDVSYRRHTIPQAKLERLEGELLELNSHSDRLQRSHAELVELQLVLEKAGSFFDDAQHRASSSSAFDQHPSPPQGERKKIVHTNI